MRVTAVSGESVTLDRKLRHLHREEFFEKPSDPNSFGAARIIPMDLGGPDGLIPSSDARLTIRQTFKDIEFVTNPSTANGSNRANYMTGVLDASFENCIMPHPVPTVVEHLRYLGGSIEDSEPDKLIATLIADGVRSGEIGGATGIELYFMRDSTSAPMQISPRQFRAINSTIDATNDRYLWYPITWAYNGPVLSVELQGTSLRINPTNSDTRVMPSIKHLELILGRDGSWSGERLIISSNSPMFLDWQVWLFEGMIVYGKSGSWGIVRRLSSAPDGSAVWADIQWMAGVKPTGANSKLVGDIALRSMESPSWMAGVLGAPPVAASCARRFHPISAQALTISRLDIRRRSTDSSSPHAPRGNPISPADVSLMASSNSSTATRRRIHRRIEGSICR